MIAPHCINQIWDQTQTRVETTIIWIPAMPSRVYKEVWVFFNTWHITYFPVHFFCLLYVLSRLYFIYFLLIFFLLFSYCYCKAKWIFSDYFLSLCLPTVWTYWISKLNKFDIVWCKISISLVTFHFCILWRKKPDKRYNFLYFTYWFLLYCRFWTLPWAKIPYLLLNSL